MQLKCLCVNGYNLIQAYFVCIYHTQTAPMGSPLRSGDGGSQLTYLEELRLQRKIAGKYSDLLGAMGVKGFSPSAEEALGLSQAARDLDLLTAVSLPAQRSLSPLVV